MLSSKQLTAAIWKGITHRPTLSLVSGVRSRALTLPASFKNTSATTLPIFARRSFSTEVVTKSLFVGNLPWELSDSELTDFFGQYGNVTSVKIMKDNQTGRPRGFGFVTLSGKPDQAVADLDGKELKGRNIRVNEAKPPQPRERRPFEQSSDQLGGMGGEREPRENSRRRRDESE